MNETTKNKKAFWYIGNQIKTYWKTLSQKNPKIAQFITFFIISNIVTILQMIMLPILQIVFKATGLMNINFEVLKIGHVYEMVNGIKTLVPYYIFNYTRDAVGVINGDGVIGHGGLAYFLAYLVVILIAQVINFFMQRKITFKSNSSVWYSAFWYVVATIIIMLGAGALQGIYQVPVYNFCGDFLGGIVTSIINSTISFWVFFPIFKVIFKQRNIYQ